MIVARLLASKFLWEKLGWPSHNVFRLNLLRTIKPGSFMK